MKIKTGKINSFSLQEMMVVLIITTVIVGMAFAVLNLVQRQMKGIENIYSVKTDVNHLRQSLWIDFNRYSNIRFDNNKSTLHFSNGLGEKTYTLADTDFLINENLVIAYEHIEFYFDNRLVDSGQIDAISIKTTKETGNQEIFVFKSNTPETYLNQWK